MSTIKTPLSKIILILFLFHIQSLSTKINQLNLCLSAQTFGTHFIDNEYTKVVLSFCNDVGEAKFSDENTTYFDLNDYNELDCFVFSSQIMCGFPGGSCGNDITIYKKTSNTYSIGLNACGFNVTPCIETMNNIHSFIYDTKQGYRIKTFWNGHKFEDEIITVNGLKYKHIKMIAEIMGQEEINFILDDFDLSNAFIEVQIEPFKIGKHNYCDLYIILLPEKHYFLIEHDKVLLHAVDIQSIESVVNKKSDYFTLKIMNLDKYTIKKDTVYLNPIYYTYSSKAQKYIQNKSIK
ncbi:MAG: hypothetical protein KA168_08580 [Chitinophagales bacterium]|nr:hypothetical protein [Chitinophagales bacterium]